MENGTTPAVLEERIKGMQATLKAEFEVINLTLNVIKDQTTKTNGSVARVIDRINEVEKKQALCPRSDFEQYKKDNETIDFYSRHPALLKFTIVGIFVINIAIGGLLLYKKLI